MNGVDKKDENVKIISKSILKWDKLNLKTDLRLTNIDTEVLLSRLTVLYSKTELLPCSTRENIFWK